MNHAREQEIQTRNSFLLALLKASSAILPLIRLKREEVLDLIFHFKQQTPGYSDMASLEQKVQYSFEQLVPTIEMNLEKNAKELGKPTPKLDWNATNVYRTIRKCGASTIFSGSMFETAAIIVSK